MRGCYGNLDLRVMKKENMKIFMGTHDIHSSVVSVDETLHEQKERCVVRRNLIICYRPVGLNVNATQQLTVRFSLDLSWRTTRKLLPHPPPLSSKRGQKNIFPIRYTIFMQKQLSNYFVHQTFKVSWTEFF